MAVETTFQVVRSDGTDILQLLGELDMSTVPILKAAVAAVPDGPEALDLSGLTFIDSSGLHELQSQATSRNGGGSLILLNVPDHIASVFSIVGLDAMPTVEIR